MTLPKSDPTGILAWFASNPVAANLLMLLILVGGVSSYTRLDTEVFPRFSPQQIEIKALYPGAGPLEIESAVCIRIEEVIFDVQGIKRINTEITQGECLIKVAVLPDYDKLQLMNALNGRIQTISRLPKGLEKISVKAAAREEDDGLIWVALHGATDSLALKRYGEYIQQQLTTVPGVSKVVNYGEVPYEIAIEVSSAKLQQYHLALSDIAAALRRASLDLPAGVVKNPAGEVLLKINGKASNAAALAALVLRSQADGSHILLGDVATVTDSLAELQFEWYHNGETAQGWAVHAERDSVVVAQRVNAAIKDMQKHLPEGLTLKTWWDDSQAYQERISTLIEDGLSGFVLVCLVLTLFLRLKVALWAGMGILTSILGALWLMPLFDVSLNMLSLFGFLLAMGVLVDDAIIIGDSIHSQQSQNKTSNLNAAIRGVQEVAVPVTLAVLVALVAFLPGLFLSGWFGQMMRPICMVMILTLAFSLIEAMLILPAHLSAPSPMPTQASRLDRLRDKLNQGLDHFVQYAYRPFLETALAWRYLTIACFILLLLVSGALVGSNRVRQSLQPDVTLDSFWVNLTVPEGAPYSEVKTLAKRVEQAFFSLRDELDAKQRQQHGLASGQAGETSVIAGLETMIWASQAGFWTEFSALGRQHIVVEDFIREWRRRVGDVGRGKIDFLYKEGDVPYDLEFDLGATDPAVLAAATEPFKQQLAAYQGVADVIDSAEPGKPELQLKLKPTAERLGLRLEDLAEQVHGAYYGEEVQRLQRGRSEVKVMVRLPLAERRTIEHLKVLPIRIAEGASAPLGTLAELSQTPGYAKLIRQNRQRVLKVQARVDPKEADVNAIYTDIKNRVLPKFQQNYPGLNVELGQNRQEQEATTASLGRNTLIALFVIYALIAVPFRSYVKPLIFLLAAPVAWSGGILAHGLLGLPLSMESLVGMIAASGVVINDSLVLLDSIREHDDPDRPLTEQIIEACTSRFRPILLAFLTNFVGFLPTLMETSPQAQFLIPMTLSLSAGLLLGMAASLILTPVCYAVGSATTIYGR
ncbi:efflux RND transporter permease subunit [Methylovulum psychrotolerans]|uniref:Acriflavin resistance protein n=1 Tax=Methylovulum psychrotolerans TaxID=1704499 RepID=A0A1Z4BU07_9GAMM|nr:efflux RND transporter permease subunit [Methylovulum psychrotolerans]ASF44785.1 acriflavin resistance protein [Methylovulum psychrotolerans]